MKARHLPYNPKLISAALLLVLAGVSPLGASVARADFPWGTTLQWAGAGYNGPGFSSTVVTFTITMPSQPPPLQAYWVGISAYDNEGRYDQLGFTTSLGYWEIQWSYTESCSPVYGSSYFTPADYHTDYGPRLTPGQTYTFRMGVAGEIVYTVDAVPGGPIWSYSTHNDANVHPIRFNHNNSATCERDGQTRTVDNLDFYEEISYINGGVGLQTIPLNFYISGITAGSQPVVDWNAGTLACFYVPRCASVDVVVVGAASGHPTNAVSIFNEFYDLRVGNTVLVIQQELPKAISVAGTVTRVSDLDCGAGNVCPVTLSTVNFPAGWTGPSFTPGSLNPSSGFRLSYTIPANTPVGYYYFRVEAADAFQKKATYLYSVGVGQGGGCVEERTPILTPHGYVQAKALRQGDKVLGFDFSTGGLLPLNVLSNNKSRSSDLVSINDGLLVVTAWDQPIYSHQGSFIGWVRDPRDLRVGDSIYHPTDGSWVPILSIANVTHKENVYEIVTDSPNNFVANGLLLDVKQM